MIDFLKFYQYGILFSAVAGAAWAVAHEVTKYAVKRWILKVPYK
jgi:hypothetical protein